VTEVRIVDVDTRGGQAIEAFGSSGVQGASLVRADGVAVTVLELAAGGEIGRHPAPSEQLLVVLSGAGTVSGEDGAWQPIGPGQAARWARGEEHGVRAGEPMRLLVVEYAPAG
jgi:quercetin dioxygenase-like cupin family protein